MIFVISAVNGGYFIIDKAERNVSLRQKELKIVENKEGIFGLQNVLQK